MADIVDDLDHKAAVEESQQQAEVIAAYWNVLRAQGLPDMVALELTLNYQAGIIGGGAFVDEAE
jgi:hypothetical protein